MLGKIEDGLESTIFKSRWFLALFYCLLNLPRNYGICLSMYLAHQKLM